MLVTANLYVGLEDCVVELVAEIRDLRTVFCVARKEGGKKGRTGVSCVCVKVERERGFGPEGKGGGRGERRRRTNNDRRVPRRCLRV